MLLLADYLCSTELILFVNNKTLHKHRNEKINSMNNKYLINSIIKENGGQPLSIIRIVTFTVFHTCLLVLTYLPQRVKAVLFLFFLFLFYLLYSASVVVFFSIETSKQKKVPCVKAQSRQNTEAIYTVHRVHSVMCSTDVNNCVV